MIVDVAARWIELVSFVFLAGTVICRLWVLPPARGGRSIQPNMWRPFGPAIGIMAAAAAVELLARVSAISGTSFWAAAGLLPLVVSHTHFGRVWLIRVALLALLAIVFLGSGAKRRERRPALLLMLLAVLLVSMTESAYGHPADKGDFTFREANDWFHLLGAEAWGGGLLALSVLVLPQILRPGGFPDDENRPALIAGVARRFSALAGIAVAVMAVTSSFNYLLYIGGSRALLDTSYGLTDLAKIFFFLALLALGAFNRYISVPALERWAGLPARKRGVAGRTAARFYSPFAGGREGREMAFLFKRMVAAESIIAIAILFCAALLGHETPAKHAIHMKQMQASAHVHDPAWDDGRHAAGVWDNQ